MASFYNFLLSFSSIKRMQSQSHAVCKIWFYRSVKHGQSQKIVFSNNPKNQRWFQNRGLSCSHSGQTSLTQNCLKLTEPGFP
jgi:hypothetical protein